MHFVSARFNTMHLLLCILAVASKVLAFDLGTAADIAYLTSLEIENANDVGDPVYINVAQGTIMGQVKSHANFSYHAFEGIPFALPPVDELRFKDPQPAGPWEGVLNATRAPTPCPQLVIIGDEDCLYLNVFTPVDSLNQSEPLPVMVFFYGGAYVMGGSDTYSGAQPLVRHNVILVTTNYRLGVLGFLSTEDSAAPGNYGLKDQTLSLQWVRDNIAAFNGDPNQVTIFGESAGSSSVHYQMLTPYATGLFTGAIMQSGSGYCPWGRGRDFRNVSMEVGIKFNCPINDTNDMIACLQTKSAILLTEVYGDFVEFNFQPFYFAPLIDGDFIPDDPVTLVKEGRYSHVPVMMGINQHEGALVSGELYWLTNITEALVENFTENAQPSLELYDDEDPLATATKIYDYYLGGLNFEYENADNVTQLYSDRLFMIPMDWLNQMTSDVDEVYVWELKHKGKNSILDLYLGLNDTLAERWICHGDDIQYVFSSPLFGNSDDPADITVRDLYTTMWTNFAKTRNPTPDGSLGFIWEPSNSADLRHLVLDANLPLSMETDQRAVDRAFWETLPLRINNLMRP